MFCSKALGLWSSLSTVLMNKQFQLYKGRQEPLHVVLTTDCVILKSIAVVLSKKLEIFVMLLGFRRYRMNKELAC